MNYVHNQWSKWKSQKTGGPEFMAVYGRSIPVLYGRPKISGPLLIYTRAVSTTNIPIVVVLGEAGVTQIDTTTWGAKDYAGGGPGGSQVFTVKDGTQTTPVTSGDPTRALAYKRTSLAVIDGTVTLPGATVPGLAFVVRGKLDSTGNSSTGDADPDQVIADMLTNTTYGLGWPSSRLTTDEWGIDSALGNRQNASYNKWLASGPIDFSFSRAITESRHDLFLMAGTSDEGLPRGIPRCHALDRVGRIQDGRNLYGLHRPAWRHLHVRRVRSGHHGTLRADRGGPHPE